MPKTIKVTVPLHEYEKLLKRYNLLKVWYVNTLENYDGLMSFNDVAKDLERQLDLVLKDR